MLTGARVAQMIARGDFLGFQHGDHVDARHAYADREESAPAVLVQIGYLIVHDVTTWLPKGFARNDFTRLLTLEFKENPAVEYVSEDRSGMSMWPESLVRGRHLDQLCHHVCALGYPWRSNAEEVGNLRVSTSQHSWSAFLLVARHRSCGYRTHDADKTVAIRGSGCPAEIDPARFACR